MDRSELSRIAHLDHPVAAPLSPDRVRHLVRATRLPPGGRVLDLGCGPGAWLLAALESDPTARGVGVDVSRPALEEAARAAAGRGVGSRVQWVEADASIWREEAFDVVLGVGSDHVFGGVGGALRALRTHLRAGGRLVLGTGIWEQPPTALAQQAIGAGPDELPDLAGLVDLVREHRFDVVAGHVSSREEWDDYEWAWTGSLIRWASARPADDPDREQALTTARRHRDEWLRGYRGLLGFATLVLLDLSADGDADGAADGAAAQPEH